MMLKLLKKNRIVILTKIAREIEVTDCDGERD